MASVREICFDTETTGLNPESGDRLYEIACIELIDGKITGNNYVQLINPQILLTSNDECINVRVGEQFKNNEQYKQDIIDKMDLPGKPIFKSISKEFLDFIGDSTLIAHNASFDIGFLNYELDNIGVGPLQNKFIDTLFMAKRFLKLKKYSLDSLCDYFNVNKEERDKYGHNSLVDTELLAQVYLHLKDLESKDKDSNNKLLMENYLKEINGREVKQSRNFKVSEDELKLHKEFILKNVKNSSSLWNY